MSSKYERELRNLLEEMGYIVFRSAGSLGGDLILRNKKNQFILIEVKSVGEKNGYWRYHVSDNEKNKEQYKEMKDLANNEVPCIYSVRWKGAPDHRGGDVWKKWEVFLISNEDDYLYQKNQSYPSYRIGEGENAENLYRKILTCENVLEVLKAR